MRLNDSSIAGLKARPSAYYVFRDDGTRGTGRLGVKVFPSGRKSFVYRYQANGKRQFKKLGDWPQFSLEEATQHYAELAAMTHTERSGTFCKKNRPGTLTDLFRAFLAHKERSGHRSTIEKYKYLLEVLKKNKLFTGDEIANEITSSQLTRCIQHWTKKGTLARADEVYKQLRALFEHGITADNDLMGDSASNGIQFRITANPLKSIQRLTDVVTPGDRYLSFEELRKMHLLFDSNPELIKPDVQALLMLGIYTCGQRPFELAHAQKSKYFPEQNKLVIDKQYTKDGRDHFVYICEAAKKILEEQSARYPDNDFYFPNVNYENKIKKYEEKVKLNPLKGYTKPTPGFDRSKWKGIIKVFSNSHFEKSFTMRDIRRTFKTLGGEIKIKKNMRDIVQYHVNSDVSSKHYDRYDYFNERKETTLRWELCLNTLLMENWKNEITKMKT